ncbi:GroES-like protein [Plenodomus tracheiphilus IPT5]|uniref:GroES-like protein n=1 Tax=Plenodomus tracheiphilus IPT5 TaxID=1408161 RepID=A0A6A7B1X0_9PLEO|nr:GroES-like protein [Plenodomus tracheiphilus IPT5]
MSSPQNRAAYLDKAGSQFDVRDAPMSTPGPGEILVNNAAIALNPVDYKMQDHGMFIKNWPATIGCDVAGTVYDIGPDVKRFKKGDRIIGHAIGFVTGRSQDGAFQQYTILPVDKAAILPDNIPFTDGVVLPTGIATAVCGLSIKTAVEVMPGIKKPALGLPFPSVDPAAPIGKVLVVYGGSSSVGSATIQLATLAGIHVIAIASTRNAELCKRCGAQAVFDYKDASVAENVINAVRHTGLEFIGILDAISETSTYEIDLAILEGLGGGHLACTQPPPSKVPEDVKVGMIFAVDDVTTTVWNEFVGEALQKGTLQCLPKPTVVGKGLDSINEGVKQVKAGVSATKLVVEL